MVTPPLRIHTFKRGLLAKLAHDLQLSIADVQVERDGPRVTARVRADAIAVDGVIRDGRLRADVLSAKDARDILANTARDVLDSARHPEIRFEGEARQEGERLRVSGTLHLHGRRGFVSFDLHVHDGLATGEVELVPSRWGIAPFTALMGAMAVQDRVVLRFAVPIQPIS
ncbi:MAG: YceI family protein [Pseudomonadota bacterium]